AYYMAGLFALDAGDVQSVETLAADLQGQIPNHPAGKRLKGMALYLKGDYENALVELQNSLKDMPDLIGFYFTGLVEYKLEQYELALNQFQKALDVQPSHAQSRLMVAMTLLKQQRLDDCISEVIKSFQYDSNNGLAYNILGSAYLAKGDFDRAMINLDKAIEIDPSLADAHLKKGLFNLSKGAPEQAESELIKALNAAPEVLNTRLLLASMYLRQQNFTVAIQVLTEGLSGDAEDALIYNYLAASYFAQKNPEQAIESLQKAKQAKADYAAPYFNLASYYVASSSRDKAVEEYRSLLAVEPANMRALLSLAALYEVMGDSKNASATYQLARKTEEPGGYLAYAGFLSRSSNPEAARQVLEEAFVAHPDKPEILESWGKNLMARGNMAGADKAFESLEKINPGSGLPLQIAIRLQQGAVADAIGMAEGQISSRPDSFVGYSLLASIHEKQGDVGKAEAALKRGLPVVADPLSLNMRLGSFWVNHGKAEQALQLFDGILKDNPQYVPALFATASIYDSQGNKRKAVELYRDVLEKDQGYTPALNNLAYLYAENYGSHEEAVELAMKAFRNEPANPGIMDTLGYALFKNGRTDEALKILEKAASILPKVSAIRLHLAQAQIAAGQTEEATESLAAVIELGPGNEQDSARQLLNELKKQ
ncbi:MAG: tetratricopeptide repeat protein, partial [Methanothrix sp.]